MEHSSRLCSRCGSNPIPIGRHERKCRGKLEQNIFGGVPYWRDLLSRSGPLLLQAQQRGFQSTRPFRPALAVVASSREAEGQESIGAPVLIKVCKESVKRR